jgi:hypothetical protein
LYWIPALIGICAFFIITGPRFLDPTNVAWLAGGDSLQHYLGWAFYRISPWTWPIGLSPFYGMEFSNSIVFTDSIPLLAIPFKLISNLLPYPFQYLGIWVLLCFILQAYFAFKILGLVTNSITVQCLACILFVLSPPMIFRLALHESLMGHFLILAALYLNLKPINKLNENKKEKIFPIAWVILLAIAVMVHFYLLVMVFTLWLADVLRRVLLQKYTSFKTALLEILIGLVVIAFFAWQAGYFAIEGASGATRGFGDFRTNLLALFNSRGWSYWLRPIPLRDPVEAATGEGFQYLGMGSIFLFLCALFAILRKKINLNLAIKLAWKSYAYLIIAVLILALISFSNFIGFGPWHFRIPLPDFLLSLLSIVRSSSRLFWPLYYIIILLVIYCVIQVYSKKMTLVLLFIAAALQIFDTSAGWAALHRQLSATASSSFNIKIKDPFWQGAGQHYQKIVSNKGNDNWEIFGIYASQNKMATNIAYLARADYPKQEKSYMNVNHQLHQGPLDAKSLYVLADWKNFPDHIQYDPQKDLLARIDGVNLLAPGWKVCSTCLQISKELEISQLAPTLSIREVVDFTKAGNGRANFMLGGWGFTEDWGTWATDQLSKVVLPLPKGEPTKLIIKANAFLSPQHAEQVVEVSINGIRIADQMTLKQAKGNTLEIKLPTGNIKAGEPLNVEFRSLDAISPMAAGLGPDERKLGIGLVSMQFVR